jgi:hypothetical protein
VLSIVYPNGAMGNTLAAMLDYCTNEGGSDILPSFVPGKNLHHYKPLELFYKIFHPARPPHDSTVIASTSTTEFGKLLIQLMSFEKWHGRTPEFGDIIYKKVSGNYGEQLEILSVCLSDRQHAFVSADHVVDVLWYWENPKMFSTKLTEMGLAVNEDRVLEFSKLVAECNQKYYDNIARCVKIAYDVIQGIHYTVNLNFFEVGIIHSIISRAVKDHSSMKLLVGHPTSTTEFIKLIKE